MIWLFFFKRTKKKTSLPSTDEIHIYFKTKPNQLIHSMLFIHKFVVYCSTFHTFFKFYSASLSSCWLFFVEGFLSVWISHFFFFNDRSDISFFFLFFLYVFLYLFYWMCDGYSASSVCTHKNQYSVFFSSAWWNGERERSTYIFIYIAIAKEISWFERDIMGGMRFILNFSRKFFYFFFEYVCLFLYVRIHSLI